MIGDFVYRDGTIQHGVTKEEAEYLRLHTPEGRGGHFRKHDCGQYRPVPTVAV